MLLNDAIKPFANNDEQRLVFFETRSLFNSFWKSMCAIYNDANVGSKLPSYIAVIKNFESTYKNLNARFRISYMSDARSSCNLYNRAFNKIKMTDMIKQRHPEYISYDLNGYTKYQYNIYTFAELYKEQIYMMSAQYGNKLNFLQIIMCFCKVAIEYFNCCEVNWTDGEKLFNDFYNNIDTEEINAGAKFYGNAKRIRKTGLYYSKKTDSLVVEVYNMLSAGEKRKDIVKKLNISAKTLYNMIHDEKNLILHIFK